MNTRGELTRDPDKGKIAGVCAGVAEYFGIELWLVRILVVSAFFLTAGTFVVVSYVAAWFILEKKSTRHGASSAKNARHQGGQSTSSGKGWQNANDDEEEKVKVKSKVWQSGEPPKQAFADIKQRFEKNEVRLRQIETYVTSAQYQLNREINNL
ncbi:MAG: PspC domain-containing protein [Alteromonadaceae bacterium]|jgi:phage shock protein C|uniref:Phage shock protein C n=2 Tax=Paraglaciecola mesophila TaxID=197222 RepID=K6ZQA6_9ALTE|nr:envelope stress response membrane protein PspC [Paraglaciecola mesophila]MAD17300.1 PspC domain-containing protein [Alteromonadaceae bacterium]MBB18319.1 PspC domain-containing protein [Rickettsiales bacterium]GAC25525.1 phage shock protein C [Paraglaciecola mesophila KMM 241]|tara:strand:+ start:7295 stop:7756 length:462 start_codon:yes stop_codon:yes gene_type:complete